MRREHLVPLSDQSLKIIEGNWPEIVGVDLLFPSLVSNRKWISEKAFNSAPRRMGDQKEEVTAHGFRATASTILNSRGFDPEVIEAALAHQDKNVIRRTYRAYSVQAVSARINPGPGARGNKQDSFIILVGHGRDDHCPNRITWPRITTK